MRKWIAFMLVLFLAVVAIGCGGGETPEHVHKFVDGICECGEKEPTTDVEVKPTEIKVSGEKAEIEVGEEFDLTIEVLPADAKNKNVRVVANPSGIVEIKDNKTIKGLKAGEVTITVSAVAAPTVKKEIKLTVKGEEVVPEVVNPTSFEITATGNEVEVGKTLSLQLSALPENATKTATWTSSDETIAKVNGTTRMVLGVAEGTVTITATSTLDPTVSATFEVKVIPAENIEIEIDPTEITVTLSAEEVEAGYKVTAKATVYPAGANQNVIWSSMRPEYATIDDKGVITGVAEGTTYIQAVSVVDGNVKSSRVKLKVLPAPAPIAIPDLQGYKIVIMNADSALQDNDPFHENYKGADKMFRQQAWSEVMKEYNCSIAVEAYPQDAPWGDQRIQWVNEQATTGAAQADFYVGPSSWISMLYAGNSIHNAKSYYDKYGKNQMDINTKAAATYRGGMYALSFPSDESKNYVDLGFYYNLGWVERLKVESPAKMFNEGRWTYSNFVKWANDVQALLGEGEKAISGSLYYMFIGMSNTAGVKIADTVKVELTLRSDRQKQIADTLKSLVASGALATTSSWAETSGEFHEKKSVMTAGCWWFLKADNRWSTDLFGEDTRYGYVPFPYPDQMKKDAIRIGENGTTLLYFASAREYNHPAGVSYEDIYQAMTDANLRAFKYYSSDASYDPETIKRTAISAKVDDPESVECAMYWNNGNSFYDAVQDFYTSPSGSQLVAPINNIIKGADYDQTIDSVEGTYVTKFQSVYSGN